MRAYEGIHMNAENPKGKEQPLNLDGINSRVAFFLHNLAESPERYLKPDAKLGGYTSLGVVNRTPELFEALTPVLKRVKEDEEIKLFADKHWRNFSEYDKQGTQSHSLFGQDRQLFLDFLKRNACVLTEWQEKTISTQMIF